MKPVVDICIVAGRRPDLLADTLSSFKKNLFDNMTVGRVIANIDPIFGDASLDGECRNVILDSYPQAQITTPETPHFCAAVQRNWLATESEFVFHLEDDWRLTEKISPDILDIFADEVIAQIILHSWHMNWSVAKRGRFSQKACDYKPFGIRIPLKYNRPMYATSPSFF